MKNRLQLFSIRCKFYIEVKTQFDFVLHILRSDNTKEYFSTPFVSFLSQQGNIHQFSCVVTPQQNGVAERKNRHLLEVTRALLFQMKVPKVFWANAVSTTCHLINHMPFSVLDGQISYSFLFPSQPLFSFPPRIFEYTCFVRDLLVTVSKLDLSLKCIFLGYSRVQKGYRYYSFTLGRYLVFADVTFFESMPFSHLLNCWTPDLATEDDFLVYSVSSSCFSYHTSSFSSTYYASLLSPITGISHGSHGWLYLRISTACFNFRSCYVYTFF